MSRLRDIWDLTVFICYLVGILTVIIAQAIWWFLRRTWAQMGVQRHG